MTKITGLEQKTFQGKPSGWKITFDDGRSGNLQEKESTKGLRVGDSVDVKEIPYTSKAGVTSTLYAATLVGQTPAPAPSNASHGLPPKPQSANCGCGTSDLTTMKFEARMKCIDLAHKAYLEGKLTDGEAKEHCVAWVAVADGLINELAK